MHESTVTTKGQTILPADVRKVLGLQPGDRLCYILLDGDVRLLGVRPILGLEGALKRSGQELVTLEDMDEAIAKGAFDQTY